jgi:hypothetical protein
MQLWRMAAEREGGGIGELEKLLEGANGNRQKRPGGLFEEDSWSFFLELGSG